MSKWGGGYFEHRDRDLVREINGLRLLAENLAQTLFLLVNATSPKLLRRSGARREEVEAADRACKFGLRMLDEASKLHVER